MAKSKTYQERKKERRIFTVIADCKSIGVWTNLKDLVTDVKEIDSEFLSYSSLSKKRKIENPILFRTKSGIEYSVTVHKINETLKEK